MLTVLALAPASSDGRSAKAVHASAGPRIILIIRHAEKPEGDGDKDPNLSKRGYERAAALARVIPANFPKPDYLVATKKSSHSMRPIETIQPLSKSLHEEIEETFKDEDFAALAQHLLTDPRYSNKTVLISWHHGKIPELAHALGAAEAPEKWSGKVFDRVWEIDYQNHKASFKDLPQKALSGDSDK